MADLQDSKEQRDELCRQLEKVEEYAARSRRHEEKAKERFEAAMQYAAEAQRGAQWTQVAAVVAVVAAVRAFFRK